MPLRYRDFAIDFIPSREGGLLARVTDSPAGEGATATWVPIPSAVAGEVAGVARAAEARFEAERLGDKVAGGDLDGRSAAELGARLFTNLFTGRVRSFFDESLGRLGGEGLRIKLQLDLEHPEVAALHGLPWEFLNNAEQDHPLGLDLRFSIIRHVPQRRSIQPAPLPRPLRILCAAAEPRGHRLLALDEELQKIVDVIHRPGEIEVHPLPGATLESIRRELTGPDEFHVLHFMGHGEFDSESGDGMLFLEDGRRGAAPVRGSLLADHLRDRTSLRLVFLNACRTARAAAPNPFGGVATSLVRAGVPAVIAMQFPITDGAAISFSETVYRRIAVGDPIDAAVTEGRIAIRTRLPNTVEWGTPVLFSHAPGGRLFEADTVSSNDVRHEAPRKLPHLEIWTWAVLLLAAIGVWLIPLYSNINAASRSAKELEAKVSTSAPSRAEETQSRSTTSSGTQIDRSLMEKIEQERARAVSQSRETLDATPSPTRESTDVDPWAGCETDVDSFENTSSFPLRVERQGEFGLIGGEFKLGNATGSGTHKRCKYCPTYAQTFRTGVTVRMTTTTGKGGIYFLDNEQTGRVYSLEINRDGEATLNRYAGDLGKILWRGSTEGRKPAHLMVEVTQGGITAVVNGRRSPTLPFNSEPGPSGPHQIGMILHGAPTEAYFDDITLTACE